MDVAIVAVGGFFACVLVSLLGIMTLLIIRAMRGGRQPKGDLAADEARLIQEIHRGLERMEQRVDTLETLLLDSRRHSEDRGEKSPDYSGGREY